MNKEEFAKVIWDNKDCLYRIAKSILKSDKDCEDAVSQAIVNAFEHLESLNKPQHAKTWLVRIVINECYSFSKKQNKEICIDETYIASEKSNELTSTTICENMDLYEALWKLPVKYRECLVLFYLEGYSTKEIATLQNTSAANIKMRLNRGRKKLKELLQK